MAMMETINLTKKYGDLVALNNLNLSINEGACFGFIGPNGAGKTTTIKILATLLKPTWGEARIDGKVIGYQNPQIRPIIGYVPDFMGAYDDMVVSEYLEFFAACYDLHGSQRFQVVRDVLELTDLTYKSNAEVNGLSRGMSQRLSIARVLLQLPIARMLANFQAAAECRRGKRPTAKPDGTEFGTPPAGARRHSAAEAVAVRALCASRAAASIIGMTRKPSITASSARSGSTSVTMTLAPKPRARMAMPRPHQP